MFKVIDNNLITHKFNEALSSERKRVNILLHESFDSLSQKMIDVLLPGTHVDIHRHLNTDETLIILRGKTDIIMYDDDMEIRDIITIDPSQTFCFTISKNVWHTINVIEPSVIIEIKDGPYKPLSKEDIYENNK